MKYFPLAYIPLMLLRREWKPAVACFISIIAVNGITAQLLGLEIYGQFFKTVFPNHLSGAIQDPFNSVFQSWHSLFRRWFVFDPALNPAPLMDWHTGFVLTTSIVVCAVIAVTAFHVYRLQTMKHPVALELQFALVTIASLTLLPASATYHFLLLIFPIALLLSASLKPEGTVTLLLSVAYGLLGFIPYHLVKGFDGQRLLTVIAYPRLWLMTVIFLLTISYVRQVHRHLLELNVQRRLNFV